MSSSKRPFYPLEIAVITVSDRHTADTDSSGDLLQKLATDAGHNIAERTILKSNKYAIRATLSQWIASDNIQIVLINGGTGFAKNNCTPEAIRPLFDNVVEGFGEQFRALSFDDIGTSAMQSRALAGIANGTLIFAMPGSGNACRLAWKSLIESQLDSRTGPCNFVAHIKNNPQASCS